MRIVAAAFVIAVLVFLGASASTEWLTTGDGDPHASKSAGRSSRTAAAGSPRSSRPNAKPRASSRAAETVDVGRTEPLPTIEVERQLSELRRRELDVKARQEALRIIFDEIRAEQLSVDVARRRVTEELAQAQNAAAAARDLERTASSKAVSEPRRPSANERPPLTSALPKVKVSDSQTASDMAVLIRRLVQGGHQQAATSLLQNMKARDAAKVLALLSTSDAQLALLLSDNLQASQQDARSRR